MKLFFISALFLAVIPLANARAEQKLEGKCTGHLENGSPVAFSYFSDYEGCEGSIASSIKFSPQTGLGNLRGKRTFANEKDIYEFKKNYKLTFEDSTGNISGILEYTDAQAQRQSVIVQCSIRDYEYADCEI